MHSLVHIGQESNALGLFLFGFHHGVHAIGQIVYNRLRRRLRRKVPCGFHVKDGMLSLTGL